MLMGLLGCENRQEHIAPAIYPKDSVSVMTSYGVNTLISDSGVIKYRIVAERWDVNQAKRISRWTFDKGLFLEKNSSGMRISTSCGAISIAGLSRLNVPWRVLISVVTRR